MKKENIFVNIWHGIQFVIARFLYFLWTVFTHIVYLPKVTYTDEATKKKMEEGPCIMIANHTSHSDGSFVPQVMHKYKPYVLVTRKWYNKKQFNWLFRNLRYIPIDLTEMDNQWLELAKKEIEAGHSVLIFPEGKLARDGIMDEFQPGFLMLARHTDAPVIPMAIQGGYKPFHRQTITVGSEIAYDVHKKGRPSVILKEGANVCYQQLKQMLGQ